MHVISNRAPLRTSLQHLRRYDTFECPFQCFCSHSTLIMDSQSSINVGTILATQPNDRRAPRAPHRDSSSSRRGRSQAERQRGDGGRGRGGKGGPRHNHIGAPPTTLERQPVSLVDHAQLTEMSSNTAAANEEAVVDDVEVCFICASPVVHNAVGPCNHRTCHICSLRLRALYKNKACAHCRVCDPFFVTRPGLMRWCDRLRLKW